MVIDLKDFFFYFSLAETYEELFCFYNHLFKPFRAYQWQDTIGLI